MPAPACGTEAEQWAFVNTNLWEPLPSDDEMNLLWCHDAVKCDVHVWSAGFTAQ